MSILNIQIKPTQNFRCRSDCEGCSIDRGQGIRSDLSTSYLKLSKEQVINCIILIAKKSNLFIDEFIFMFQLAEIIGTVFVENEDMK